MKMMHILLFVLLFASCSSFDSMRSHSVCEVVSNPRKFSDFDQVTLKGKVTDAAGLLGYNGFILKDIEEECTIIVITERITPNLGEEVIVKGKLKDLGTYGDTRFLAIEEKK